jgi:hypothetical protein
MLKENQPSTTELKLEDWCDKEQMEFIQTLAIISHSPAEFVMDFTRVMPGVPKAKVFARIVMTPQHAKMFLGALMDNIRKFEQQFGEIKTDRQPNIFPGFPNNPKVN